MQKQGLGGAIQAGWSKAFTVQPAKDAVQTEGETPSVQAVRMLITEWRTAGGKQSEKPLFAEFQMDRAPLMLSTILQTDLN